MSDFSLCSKNFVLACAVTFFYFGSFYLILPVLPQFVVSLDGASGQVGLVMGIMTLTSVLVRPYFGRVSDRRGRRFVMLLGSLAFALFFIGYMYIHEIRLLYFVRILHGMAHGAMLAALFAFVADLAPRERRGEVMGIHGVSNVVAMAMFPAIGTQFMAVTGSFTWLFMFSLLMCAIACLCVFFIDAPGATLTQNVSVGMMKVFTRTPVMVAAFTYLGASILYGTVITFLPIYGPENNVANVGLFFSIYAVFTFISRLAAGRLSDRYGRAWVIIPALSLTALGGFTLVFLDGVLLLALAGALFGLGFGGFLPALNAFVVDNTSVTDRSTALALYTSFMDIGMSIGAICFGLIGELIGYPAMFTVAASLTCCSVLLFSLYLCKRPARTIHDS